MTNYKFSTRFKYDSNDEDVIYTNWESGEPSNSNGIEHCVTLGISGWSDNSKWLDDQCRPYPQDQRPYVCEI